MEHGELKTVGTSGGSERTRRAVLALWAIPGLGAVTLEHFRRRCADLADLLDVPIVDWLPEVEVADGVRKRLLALEKLKYVAEVVLERAERAKIQIAHAGDPAFPANLIGIPQQPPLLFYRGTIGRTRRRLAMVGTRHPEDWIKGRAFTWARELAARGLGVVSGAAIGIDQKCHEGALAARGETWAFMGSALDQVDSAQVQIAHQIVEHGGCLYSELPPGVRANTQSFPRRNRLISGASDAVLVLRAGAKSGALHTSGFAREQGRPVLAWPGELESEQAVGTNGLLHEGAGICLSYDDALKAVGLTASEARRAVGQSERADMGDLSEEARLAYRLLRKSPQAFEELHAASEGMEAGTLLSALSELELYGLALQRAGKLYEKV